MQELVKWFMLSTSEAHNGVRKLLVEIYEIAVYLETNRQSYKSSKPLPTSVYTKAPNGTVRVPKQKYQLWRVKRIIISC